MVNVCPMCKRVLNEGEECGCLFRARKREGGVQQSEAAKVITGMGASTAFFVITLLYTMSVFFNALSSGSSFLGLYGGATGRPGGFSDLAGGSVLWQTGLMLLALTPSVLICVGLWNLCFGSRNQNAGLTGPLYLIKGAVIAQFSILFLLNLVVEAALVVSLSFIRGGGFALAGRLAGGLSQMILGTVIVLIAGITFLLVLYMIHILKAADVMIRSLQTGERWGDVPAPLIVMNYIFAALNLVSAGLDIRGGNAAAAASAICAAAFLAGMSASLSTLKRSL